jgi:hypothetical protein
MHTHTHAHSPSLPPPKYIHTQILALIALIAGASAQNSVDIFEGSANNLSVSTDAAGGWLIFVSFWVMLYQAIVIVQRFLNFGIINNAITIFLVIVSLTLITWASHSLSTRM